MPRGDRRGPEGAGSMTGRGLGYCSGNSQPGYRADEAPQGAGRGFRKGAGQGPGFGRGQGRGRGRGMGSGRASGWARGAYYAPDAESGEQDLKKSENREREITRLENLANTLTSELEIVKNRIDELKSN